MRSLVAALILSCILPLGAEAQLKLFLVSADGTSEREATGLVDVGSSSPGDLLDTRFRIRNVGVQTLTLQTFTVSGQGFSVPSAPLLPSPVASGAAVDVRVRFTAQGAGSYSASLNYTGGSVLLLATVVAAPVLTTQSDTGSSKVDLASGTAIYLGRILKGATTQRALWLENRGRDPLTVRSLSVAGTGFSYRGPAPPFTIAAGAVQAFSIDFAPTAAKSYTGTLSVDGRTFPLTGAGYDPPLPKATIRIEGTSASGQQPRLFIDLAAAAEFTTTGTLRMEFKPLAGLPDDPGVVFAATGSRNISFEVKTGDTQASFGASKQLIFQTGTTAGTLSWTLDVDSQTQTQTMQIAPAAPVLASATGVRRAQDLDVSLTGFDNARSITQARFTFYDTAGRPIAPGTILADVRQPFADFFQGSTATGGVFALRAAFPVSGGAATAVAAVEVELTNTAGSVRTERITFP